MTVCPSYTVPIDDDKCGLRLDRVLADALPDLSRSRLQTLIGAGRVREATAGPVSSPSRPVRTGERYIVTVPIEPPETVRPEAIPLDIIYEDDDLIIVNKPPGLVVHPGAGNPDGTLVNGLLYHCNRLSTVGAPLRPGIVHRLDKDTSGLLVAAKTDAAHAGLTAQFARHDVEREYAALVWGRPVPSAGLITGNIGRDPDHRKRMAVVPRGGKPAATGYGTVEDIRGFATLLACWPRTGRTHQIRVHLAHIGHPIVGDPLYGRRRAGDVPAAAQAKLLTFPRQALHAQVIGVDHPIRGERIRFAVPLYNDINELIDNLKAL